MRNPHGEGWGKLVSFADPDRNQKRRIIGDAMLSGDGIELERMLRDAGLHIAPGGRQLLRQYLIEATPKARARVTNRTGWHDSGDGDGFRCCPIAPSVRAGNGCTKRIGIVCNLRHAWHLERLAGRRRRALQWKFPSVVRRVRFPLPRPALSGGMDGGGFHLSE